MENEIPPLNIETLFSHLFIQSLVGACDDESFFGFFFLKKKKRPPGTTLFPLNQIQLFILQSKMSTGHGPNMD